MTKIKTYTIKTPVVSGDKWIGTNGLTGETKNFDADGVAEYVLAGLSPETGGTFKITEIEIATLDTDVATTVNAISPFYDIQRYEIVFFNIEGQIFVCKKTNQSIGSGETALVNGDFVEFPISVGPQGPQGDTGPAGADGANGQDYTANNLQRTVTSSFTLANSDNNYTIVINNGSSDITITIPSGLISKIAVGFIQQGTGNVTFVESSTTINSPSSFTKIKGENFWCYIEQVSNSNVYQLTGALKA